MNSYFIYFYIYKKKKTFYGTKFFTLELQIVGLATYKCGGKITHVTR